MADQGKSIVAVVLEEPKRLSLRQFPLPSVADDEVVVDVEWSGISTGTERLLWSGDMPAFPGMGYPLVPGYESAGRVVEVGRNAKARIGDRLFVPGARCFGDVRGLFGGAASTLVVSEKRTMRFDSALGEEGVLFALAATAYHAIAAPGALPPELIVGHGVLGRLLARVAIARGGEPPVVWEKNASRTSGSTGYAVLDPDADPRRDYKSIYDVSGDSALLNTLIARLARGGEVTLAGFYSAPLSFAFPPAFMREARLRVAAEWAESDLIAVRSLVEDCSLSLDGLITHRGDPLDAGVAYRVAFDDPACLKMILDWRTLS